MTKFKEVIGVWVGVEVERSSWSMKKIEEDKKE